MDREYWNEQYRKDVTPKEQSLFAEHMLKVYKIKGKKILELGCGNGRDAVFFAKFGECKVFAVDQSETAISQISKESAQKNLELFIADFTDLDDYKERIGFVDLVYSRFAFHSVTVEGKMRVIKASRDVLSPNGLLAIETRGRKNSLYGKGKPVRGQIDTFIAAADGYDNAPHSRRFDDLYELCSEIVRVGFEVLEADEKAGFAPYGGEDDVFIRIVARKLSGGDGIE